MSSSGHEREGAVATGEARYYVTPHLNDPIREAKEALWMIESFARLGLDGIPDSMRTLAFEGIIRQVSAVRRAMGLEPPEPGSL